jgi:uncharacterized protein
LILPDVNVLIYAFRSDAEGHLRYKRWLELTINGPGAYGVSPQVLSSVVRITTHPRIFARPSRPEQALDFCESILHQPNATVIEPGPRHWAIFRELCVGAQAGGNLVQDAWLAALAIESGCEWITTDRDFARFPGLSWRLPELG